MKRFSALLDKSAWLLIVPAVLFFYVADASMLLTMLQWTAYAVIIAGIAIIVSRIVFPQIHLGDLIEQAHRNRNTAAAIVAASVILFLGILICALVFWAKS